MTFGMGHIVNLLTGHAAPETIVQVFWAIAMGFIFTMVYYKSGSLLPGILAHSLIDVFSVFSGRSDTMTWIFIGVTVAVAVGYGFYLRAQETPTINRIARTEK